jgi:hypothetical protein
MQDMLKVEENDNERLLQNIIDLGTQLYQIVSDFGMLSVRLAMIHCIFHSYH